MKKPSNKKVPQGEAPRSPSQVSAGVGAFLNQVAQTPVMKTSGSSGRLLFALDATLSRQPTWDTACHIQSEMFQETASLGGLEVQLGYFRGFNEFRVSPWAADSSTLLRYMTGIECQGGHTQIERLLRHARKETQKKQINALVYIGDSFEENLDRVCHVAGELGLLGVRTFLFHEGRDRRAEQAFREIARLTGGAYCRFDAGAAKALKELIAAVAVYAAGGRAALEDYGQKRGGQVLKITNQIR